MLFQTLIGEGTKIFSCQPKILETCPHHQNLQGISTVDLAHTELQVCLNVPDAENPDHELPARMLNFLFVQFVQLQSNSCSQRFHLHLFVLDLQPVIQSINVAYRK